MTENRFFVLVGATGSGKNTMLGKLEDHFTNDSNAVPCDSTTVDRVTTSFIRIDTTCGRKYPLSKLLKIWSRISEQIEGQVKPALLRGDRVIMNAFGGTAFAEAMVHASSDNESKSILEMHKAIIPHCVIGIGVRPPIYIWLKVSPEVALLRRRADKTLPKNITDPLGYIENLNKQFEFYGSLPGQTVIPVDANQPIEMVFRDILNIIDPQDVAEAA